MKMIYHLGTDTYFGLDDGVVVIDLDRVPLDVDAEVMDDMGRVIAETYGRPIELLNYQHDISISPAAIREEAQERLAVDQPTGRRGDILEWAAYKATDDELNDVSVFVMSDETMWDAWFTALMDGIDYIYGKGK